ncbi:MAG: helix-turn-helix transcriptional regulator [Bacteroidetes bacterium]|uniref:Helix-turn-helix transcriptional regulator n=1 Tax=Candidatus Cryptobacteroides intestinavium TaxID=2840766 RepID=A0A9D9ETB6_9BACT|nr:helix-turn-helix transcriptional regulator [Candidatus Cryptobacteroides intestinavium]
MDNSSVKKNISRIRKASGISQTEMAERLGISRTAYRNIETGDTKLINDNVDRIASLLDTTSEELVLGYTPSAKDSMKVNDIQKENALKQKEMAARFETEIARLNEQINTLKEYIDALQETVRTKDEMISMLKRKVAGDL